MNGEILRALKELEKDEEIPARVSNRLILAGIISLFDKLENGDYDNRIKFNGRVLKFLIGLNILVVGALIAL